MKSPDRQGRLRGLRTVAAGLALVMTMDGIPWQRLRVLRSWDGS